MTQSEALLLTLAIEVPIAVGLVAALRWTSPRRLLLVAASSLAASTWTHPLLWMVEPLLAATIRDRALRLGLLEAGIALVEAAVYWLAAGLPPRRALLVSVVANGASLGAGLLIYALTTPS